MGVDYDLAVFGPRSPNRQCGECAVCCEHLNIDWPELKKPPGVLCPHHTGTSCGLHPHWPGGCEQWNCAWRRFDRFPEAWRPDRSGLLVWMVRTPKPRNILDRVHVMIRALHSPDAFRHPLVPTIVNGFAKTYLPVMLHHESRGTVCAHPREEIERILVHGQQPSSPAVAAEAETWRRELAKL